ncbi:AAA family ATPase [Flavobacterium sp. HXWNR69]|uniref:AAA family ATPase n=1 Tax=Flavobacterium fragile TaxID=2949085 RepID=A0ABT0THF4_9FLAO|nr:AAA family ATPase [Flavobacterium sp. HXWNR69]MCL9770406.1 AAA family ATPase [Flavobacterium sp. HXWNR69]
MTDRAQKLIKYIFETEIDKIEGSRLSENKGLSALCLLYKTDLNPEELSKKYGVNIQFNNINTASVPEFISEISKYIDIKVFQSKPENQSKTELASKFKSVNIIFYGAPGTGKSYKVDKIIENLDSHYYERITFHPEYDNASFIGGYKPISDKDSAGNDTIKYKFVPQAFTNIYERAWQDLENPYFLVIEEINRGNCAEIFGEIFQLLDRNSSYTVTPSKELKEYLINEAFEDENHLGIVNGLKLPPNLSILATMNTSDQSLFPMDSAFKRRWDWEYVPICYEVFYLDENNKKQKNDSFDFEINIEDGKKYSWIKFIEKINLNHIKVNPSLGMDKCIGNYFIKPDNGNVISLKPFVNKVIFYLWNDVFKDEDNKVFEENTSYEDFFPIETNGKKKIKELFDRIDLKAIPSLEIVEDENPLGQVAESPEEMES